MKAIQDFPALREQMSCTIAAKAIAGLAESKYIVGKKLAIGWCNHLPEAIVDFSENISFGTFEEVNEFLKTHFDYTFARCNQLNEFYTRFHMIYVPCNSDDPVGPLRRVFLPLSDEDYAKLSITF